MKEEFDIDLAMAITNLNLDKNSFEIMSKEIVPKINKLEQKIAKLKLELKVAKARIQFYKNKAAL